MFLPIYLDNHATTRLDSRVLDAMLPYFTEIYGNPGSVTHAFGQEANQAVEAARKTIIAAIGASPKEIIFTSGATESNNLAIRGIAERLENRDKHFISATTEHPSVLEPLKKLAKRGGNVTFLQVLPSPDARAGLLSVEEVSKAIRDDTVLVSVMLANHEIGAIAPLETIGQLCKERGVLLHTDATQAVGKIPVDVEKLHVDLMSFSAHKIYGPKGIGALYVRRRSPRVLLESLIDGGGQQEGIRSGTLNVPGIVGFARALELCLEELPGESLRLVGLRNHFYQKMKSLIPDISLNGPTMEQPGLRLPNNLNLHIPRVSGETLLLHLPELALSSGSACTSAQPEPSHVLQSLGLSPDEANSSIRIGLGRYNTQEEVDYAVDRIADTVAKLRAMNPR